MEWELGAAQVGVATCGAKPLQSWVHPPARLWLKAQPQAEVTIRQLS